MGIFKKIGQWVGLVNSDEPASVPKGSIMDEENQSTLILGGGEPDMNTAIGMDGTQRMSPQMIVANSQINNAVSASHPIPGQRNRPRGRGRGVGQPQQMAPIPQGQYEAPVQQQQPVQQPQYPQYPQYQGGYPQYQGYPQYPMYPQPPQPPQQPPQPQQMVPPQNVPVQSEDSDGEPFSEFIMVNGVYHVYIDLPGVSDFKNTLNVQFIDDALVISGERIPHTQEFEKKVKGSKNKGASVKSQINIPDYLLNKFKFSFPIPKAIDETTLGAEYVNGQLHVTMSLRASVTGVTVAIK